MDFPAVSARPFPCGRCAWLNTCRIPSRAHMAFHHELTNCAPWSDVTTAGTPISPQATSNIKCAARSPVRPAYLVGRAMIHPVARSTHTRMQSTVTPCHSTSVIENMSKHTLDINPSMTGLIRTGRANDRLGGSHAWQIKHPRRCRLIISSTPMPTGNLYRLLTSILRRFAPGCPTIT